MEFNINEPKNIVGFSSLMHNSKEILDLEKIIINGKSNIEDDEINLSKQYQMDMERLSNTYNITDISDNSNNNVFDNDNEPEAFSSQPISKPIQHQPSYIQPVLHQSDYTQQSTYNNSGQSNSGQSNYKNMDFIKQDNHLNYMTMEQKRQSYVDDVLHDINDDKDLEFDIDKEKDEDDKNSLLEQIDMLRSTLEDDTIDISNIPIVTKDNNMSDIQNVYKILRLKNDRNRYCSFAEELILSGAHGIEYLFDGKNDWFGRCPDLTGWSNTCRIKLRRCRFQTSTLVKQMMQEYNISAGFQLMIELIPSIFLYSRQKKLSYKDNIADDSTYTEAVNNLNQQMN
jgi:hypothetical protein